jgi:hypothetical protein
MLLLFAIIFVLDSVNIGEFQSEFSITRFFSCGGGMELLGDGFNPAQRGPPVL